MAVFEVMASQMAELQRTQAEFMFENARSLQIQKASEPISFTVPLVAPSEYYFTIDRGYQEEKVCQCGCEKVGSSRHSSWCPKNEQ